MAISAMRSLRLKAGMLTARVSNMTIVSLKKLAPPDQPFEEERVPGYHTAHFYSVSPGDVVGDGAYSIVTKLGWGCSSTVWLAKDLRQWDTRRQERYVSIKFNNCDVDQGPIKEELNLLRCLSDADRSHPGIHVVRKLLDSFEIKGERGTHLCLVCEPLRETFELHRRRFRGGCLPESLLKVYVKVLLVGLDYLHESCGIIHTDLKLDNLLLDFEDDTVLVDAAKHIQQCEQFFKDSPARRVFQSFSGFGPIERWRTAPVIADFGRAQRVKKGAHPIQPDAYRAPEVLLGWEWTRAADIWNLACLIWILASGRELFTPHHSEDGAYSPIRHVAQMIATLEPPNPDLIRQRGQTKWKWDPPIENQYGELCEDACSFYKGPFFDAKSGKFLHEDALPALRGLGDLASSMRMSQKAQFLDFLGKMLTWDPNERLGASELLEHPWLA